MSGNRNRTAGYTVRTAVALLVGTATTFTLAPLALYGAESKPAAAAADAAASDELTEVQITGSRITRRDAKSNSPLVTVEGAQLENRSSLNIESYLNQMPQFNPASAPTVNTPGNADVQISAVNSVGIATISQRGFGPNRNLVLMDGHRTVPINALMVTDINSIPSAMIKRLEIISGGASATYGADALGGVTNFIMNDNFQGLELDAQGSFLQSGGGRETRQSALMGTNFSNGRGNITIGVEHYDRKAALERDHDFFTKSWSDPNVASDDFFLFGSNGYSPGLFNFAGTPSSAARDAVFPNRPTGSGTCSFGCLFLSDFRFGPNGRMFLPGAPLETSNGSPSKYALAGGAIDGREFAIQNIYDPMNFDSSGNQLQGVAATTVKYNNVNALASAPQTRFSFYGSGKYDITDSVQLYSRATYAESKTRTRLFGTNASFGWEAMVPYNPTTDSPLLPTLNYNNTAVVAAALADPTNALYKNPGFIATGAAGAQHPVTPEMAALLNSRGVQNSSWMVQTFPNHSFDQRGTLNVNNVWNIETGLRFDVPLKDWKGDLYYSRGQSSTYNLAYGDNSLKRWRAVVAAADYGRNGSFQDNLDGASSGFGSVPIKCTSGFYSTIFLGDQKASADCNYAVQATLQTRTQNQQDNAELNFNGGLMDLPAGEVRAALGFQYRQNAAQFVPDILQSTASFTDQVIGVYPTGPLDARIMVREAYGEALIPLVADLPYLKKAELEVGGRISDYDATASTKTYKLLGRMEFNDYLTLRGGFNRASRAPNLGELFLDLQEIFAFGGNTYGDPCGLRSLAPFGAGGALADPVLATGETQTAIAPGQNTAGQQSAYLICRAQMGTTGATNFYTSNASGGTGSAFNWVFQKGNRNLVSETADTYTIGLTLRSPFKNALLSGLNATIDWWKVGIKNAIEPYSVDYAHFRCYGAVQVTNATEALAQAQSDACLLVPRNQATGGETTVSLAYDNQATIATSGIDVAANWRAMLSDMGLSSVPGALSVNMQASFLSYYKTKQSPASYDVETDWKGSLGPDLTGTNGGSYKYRINTSFNYMVDKMSFGLLWRYLPSVNLGAKATEDAIIANNAAVKGGASGIILGYTPGTWVKTKSYSNFDFTSNWDLNSTISIRAGITNLLDTNPRITGATNGYPKATYTSGLTGVCGAAPGCINPSSYSLGSSGSGVTNRGFYDVLGRSFYVGVKARF